MKKYIVTQEQVDRIAKVNLLLAREIATQTLYQEVDDSLALITHLDNIAKQLVFDETKEYDLPVTGGRFVWEPEKGKNG